MTKSEFEILMEKYLKKGAYLNIWDKIPSYNDFNLSYCLLKAFFLFGLGFLISVFSYDLSNNLRFSIVFGGILTALFFAIFRDSIFRFNDFFKISEQKIYRIHPFRNIVFWQDKTQNSILFHTNKKDLVHTGIKVIQMKTIPSNVHANLNQFIKTMYISRIPFTYQIIQCPSPSKSKIYTSIYFALFYSVRGLLTNKKIEMITSYLEEFYEIFKGNLVANYHHFQFKLLSGNKLVDSMKVFTLQKNIPKKDSNKLNHNNKGFKRINLAKAFYILILIGILDFFFVQYVTFPMVLLLNILFISITSVLWWREALFYFNNRKLRNGDAEKVNPFLNIEFLRNKEYTNSLFFRYNNQVGCIKSLNLKYAYPNLYGKDNHFVATPEILFRTLVNRQIPFSYTLTQSPILFDTFYKNEAKCLKEKLKTRLDALEREIEEENWINQRSGMFYTILNFSTFSSKVETSPENDFISLENKCTLNIKTLYNSFKSTYPNFELEEIQNRGLVSSVLYQSLKHKFYLLNQTHLSYLIFQGKTLMWLNTMAEEFKKGLETKIAAEFNTPLHLSNFIEFGKTINTEFLEEELPAGLTEPQLKSLLITNGTWYSREVMVMKIVTELLKKNRHSIIFDFDGSWSRIINYLQSEGLGLEENILYLKLGDYFSYSIFNSGLSFDSDNLDYVNLILDAYSLAYKKDKRQLEMMKEELKKSGEDEPNLELYDLENEMKPSWEKDKMNISPISVLEEFREKNMYFTKEGKKEEDLQKLESFFPLESLLKMKKTIIIDLTVLVELEHKLFAMFIFISKIVHFLNRNNMNGITPKNLILPNMDTFFEQFHIDTRLNYGKIDKFLSPLTQNKFGLILSANQIRYLHQNVFNYCRNYISFRATDKRDLTTLKNQMNLQELHGTGYYSSKRKESYQIDYLMELGDNEVLMKRYDLNQPFPVKLDFDQIVQSKQLSEKQIKDHMTNIGYDIESMENLITHLAKKTLFDKDLGSLSMFTEEVIKFLSLLKKVDKIGNMYKSKLKEILMKVIYPKTSQKFSLDKHQIKQTRDNLLETLINTEYIVESHPRRAGGSQSIRTSYAVGFKFETALDDYLMANKMDLSEVTSESIDIESGKELGLEDFLEVEPEEKTKFSEHQIEKALSTVLAKNLIWNYVIMKERLDEGNFDKVLFYQRDIIRRFLRVLYAQFKEGVDKMDVSNPEVDEAIDFLLENNILPFEKPYLESLCNLVTKEKIENKDLEIVLNENLNKVVRLINQIREHIAGE